MLILSYFLPLIQIKSSWKTIHMEMSLKVSMHVKCIFILNSSAQVPFLFLTQDTLLLLSN